MSLDRIERAPLVDGRPCVVAVGFRRIKQMLNELAPELQDRALVRVLDVGFDEAVSQIKAMQTKGRVDVLVAAGSNGAHLRQHLDVPVVLVKVGGLDLMQALAQAKRCALEQGGFAGLVSYVGMAPDLQPFESLFGLQVRQRSYVTEDEAEQVVRALQAEGVRVVVGSGVVLDCAERLGLTGIFLYSHEAVREALNDALEVARAGRIEHAKRERLNTILTQLTDGVIAVDAQERVQTINPAMAQWLGVQASAWLGRSLTDACPELSLRATLKWAAPELEKLERVRGKNLIVSRMPIIEQGVLTGAVLTAQDPISIQRVDRHIRSRIQPQTPALRHELSQLLGDSPAIQQVQAMALRCAASLATVLIMGESGTGKELVAQGIHRASARSEMPFVAVNCAAVTETLLESELFGYEDGAFTGARKGGKIGLFEAAHNGTIFLDEIGEMPLALQARLLRVLQEREVLRVGATEPTPVNVRIIAATHRDLQDAVAQGEFRQDLFYRLNILRIDMPALRERGDDLTTLSRVLHQRICQRLGVPMSKSEAAVQLLLDQAQGQRYAWPGNVRELENLIERLVAYMTDVPEVLQSQPLARPVVDMRWVVPELFQSGASEQEGFKAKRLQSERAEIERVLRECGGDRGLASERLGLSRTTLWRKLKGQST